MKLQELIPDPEVLLKMEPEQLGASILQVINSRPDRDKSVTLGQLVHELFEVHQAPCPQKVRTPVFRVLAEAWNWLEIQGLLVWSDQSNGPSGWRIPSRRCEKLTTESEFRKYLNGSQLPKEFFHPKIRGAVWLLFLGGDYDTAVFKAFKEVEVSVRSAAGLTDKDYSVNLMRKAFHVQTGPLTDKNATEAEREALTHLFSGTIGYYKNPQSHRDVGVDDAAEARELIMLASNLLRIVDARLLD